MADDTHQRSFRESAYPRASRTNSSGNDPLAELARLIGQTDPFAEFGRQQSQQPVQHQPGSAPQSQAYAAQQPQAYDQHGYQAAVEADAYPQEQYAEADYDPNVYYEDAPGIEGEQDYDDEPPPRRRLSIIAIAAVLALAVVGTAGAFGYKALFGSSGSTPPPVIKADSTPAKVVPPSKSEPQSSKLIYDRVGERSGGEKIVSREEQPIDIKDSKPAPSANAFPGGVGGAAPTVAPATADSTTTADQPKKIHTIPIRPETPPSLDAPPATPMRSAAAAPVSTPPAAPAPKPAAVPPAPPQRLASAPSSTADAEDTVSASRPGPTPVHPAAPRSANAPLSLSPDAVSTPAAARPAPAARTASVPPAPAHAGPSASASGQYAVQVSSQRSEAEAEAAFRSLQAKYPSQLGGRQPMIRRADLGSKGIYYRALVGPFANAGEAGSLCQSLKSAGGSCLIQKN